MPEISPAYKKLLIAAVAVYMISSCLMNINIYRRINKIEHALSHIKGACGFKK